MTISELNTERESKVTEMIKASGMFFAFSIEQLEANKTPLDEGDKYVSLGSGAYMPKSKLKIYLNGCDAIDKWYADTIAAHDLRSAHIAHELNNHECYYTGEIDDALDALGEGYTAKEVWAVFNKNRKQIEY